MELKLRKAQEKDLDGLDQVMLVISDAAGERETVKRLLKKIDADPQKYLLVAEDREGNVLGYAGLHVVLDEGYIDNVAVRSDSRGQGVASALLGVYCRFGQAHLAFLTLEVRAGNRPAIQLYLKHGFEQVGRRKNYYRQPTEDAIIMTKEFAHGTEDPETGAAAADL